MSPRRTRIQTKCDAPTCKTPDAMRQIESAVLEDQVVDCVVGKAKVTDKPPRSPS